MSTTPTNDGGPAFSSNLTNYKCKQKLAEDLYQFDGAAPGMSLRDYFAAKALQGFLANKEHSTSFDALQDADYCYEIADAMIAARNQTTK